MYLILLGFALGRFSPHFFTDEVVRAALIARHNDSRHSVVACTADSAAAGSATAQLFIATTWAATAACGSGALVMTPQRNDGLTPATSSTALLGAFPLR